MKNILIVIIYTIFIISCSKDKMNFNITVEETFRTGIIMEEPLKDSNKRIIYLECKDRNCKVYRGTKYLKENLVYDTNITGKQINKIMRLLKELEKKRNKNLIFSGTRVEVWQKGKNERRITLNTYVSNEIEEIFSILGYSSPIVKSDERYINGLSGEKFTYENIPKIGNNVWKLYCEKNICKIFYYKIDRIKNIQNSRLIKKWETIKNLEEIQKLKNNLIKDIIKSEGYLDNGNLYIMVFDNGKYYWKLDEKLSEDLGEYGEIINNLIKEDYKKIEKSYK